MWKHVVCIIQKQCLDHNITNPLRRLTAFVVRTFSQAHGIIDVDQTVQTEAIDWMKKKQSQDGSFPSVCRVLHKEMQGCSGGECSLTAYVTLALLEAGVPASVRQYSNLKPLS